MENKADATSTHEKRSFNLAMLNGLLREGINVNSGVARAAGVIYVRFRLQTMLPSKISRRSTVVGNLEIQYRRDMWSAGFEGKCIDGLFIFNTQLNKCAF